MNIKEIAKTIRAILKATFPATKFSVTIKRFSMGESVEVDWTDGPTKPQVNDLIGQYGDTRFRFINTSRKHSIEFADKVIKVWKEQNPEYAHFAITSQGKVDCYGIEIGDELYGSNDIRQDCEDSIYRFLRNSTLDSLTLATPPENIDKEVEIVTTPEPEAVKVTETAPQPQEPARDLTLELINLQELLISKLEEVNQLKLQIAELQVERDAAKYNQQQSEEVAEEVVQTPAESEVLRPATPEEARADILAKRFAEDWENWNVFDTGYFLKYKRPHSLTAKQVDWLRDVWLKQYKWGSKAYEKSRGSIDNMGSTYQREFMWQVSVHRNGSGTFEILVRK